MRKIKLKKTKILTVTTTGLYKKEGITTVILDYYSQFDKEKFELDIIASGEYCDHLIREFQNIDVNICYLSSRKEMFFTYIMEYFSLMRKRKYDAIYIHGSSAIMAIELLIAKMCRCRTRVVHSHNTYSDHRIIDKFLRPIFYSTYTQALACGTDAGRWLYEERQFDIVKNGRNIEKYRYNPSKRKEVRKVQGLSEDTVVIGHVGNFNMQKNQKYIISIMEKIVERKKNVKLYLIGDGSTKKNIQQLVTDRGLQEFVTFTGNIKNVPDMLQAMDVMVLPSLFEGLPLVVVEWQIAALPCILSDKVTRECAYTNLVHFRSLDDDYTLWAEEILSMSKFDRLSASEEVLKLTKQNGFDISENVEKLQSYFCQ